MTLNFFFAEFLCFAPGLQQSLARARHNWRVQHRWHARGTIFFCDARLAPYLEMGSDSDSDGGGDASWESKWTEKQEKYKAYAVSKLQKHLAEIQEDIDKYDVKLEKLRKKGAPRSAATAPRRALLTRRLRPPRRAQKRRARRTRRRARK